MRNDVRGSGIDLIPKFVYRTCKDCKRRSKCYWNHAFSQTGKPEYRTRCKICTRNYQNQIASRNRKKISEGKRFCCQNRKIECVKLLGGKCCRCGYDKCMSALTFHHQDPKFKTNDIARLIHLKSFEYVKEELKQCELLCFNCHMEEEEALRAIEIGKDDELRIF